MESFRSPHHRGTEITETDFFQLARTIVQNLDVSHPGTLRSFHQNLEA